MRGSWLNDPVLLGPMMGIISGINILAETMVAAKLVSAENLAQPFQMKIDQFLTAGTFEGTQAATVLEMLMNHLVDLERAAARKLLNEPPHGEA